LKVVYGRIGKGGVLLMVNHDHPPFTRSEYAA